ncbi:serine hydrolase domain-containing protein [Streptomyces sp. ICBB 8177]|uniref:serine hydrolase domain-containing protein n=1 Tax=Streptomyces sp. ICBB 8177 TaxID=563922 RepID=UPI000D67F541|nr:serine hydrolase domain-containing protein [Streptomyces sp. ICBB 8177]PWI41298.1 D-alanyl-D-alanine carboxypeptidase [Streptomyces sp. ICBB 8177]
MRNRRIAVCAAVVALAVGTGGVAPAAFAVGKGPASAAAKATVPYGDVNGILRRLTTVDGAPGALAEVSGGHGRTTVLTSGVADLATGAPMAADSRFRIGSMTKMFVATVLLQLVAERKVGLDAPIERYLPGVVRAHGNDGRDITVRQLLQHTSGLPDYLDYLSPQTVLSDPLAHYSPKDLLKLALAHPPVFAPGTGWSYSNTDYVVAGLLIEAVTGHPYGEEIDRRVIEPLGLHDTSVPVDASAIPGTHPHGYAAPTASERLDVSAFDPSVAYASGAMISSGADMNRFLGALLGGRLLPPAELRAMRTTVPTGDASGSAYGLGLESVPLPCGGRLWGHDGGIPGFETMSGATADGRAATVMVDLDPGGTAAQDADIQNAVATALCEHTVSPAPERH